MERGVLATHVLLDQSRVGNIKIYRPTCSLIISYMPLCMATSRGGYKGSKYDKEHM